MKEDGARVPLGIRELGRLTGTPLLRTKRRKAPWLFLLLFLCCFVCFWFDEWYARAAEFRAGIRRFLRSQIVSAQATLTSGRRFRNAPNP